MSSVQHGTCSWLINVLSLCAIYWKANVGREGTGAGKAGPGEGGGADSRELGRRGRGLKKIDSEDDSGLCRLILLLHPAQKNLY